MAGAASSAKRSDITIGTARMTPTGPSTQTFDAVVDGGGTYKSLDPKTDVEVTDEEPVGESRFRVQGW